ncbi:cytochrome P450 71B34-like [Papaver somniferum]|uniref:cytochrome P450 71B34-like n=1 Tax=Papaver somniferum TaxID=3469 RepID=UPI000E6FA48B|nr:cytochrome P450 71B34-like [Papaver somniferum]
MEFLLPYNFFLLFPLIPLLVYYIMTSKGKYQKSRDQNSPNFPPSPPKLPIIGNLHQLACKPPHLALHKLSQKYGPVMLLKLGSVPTLVITSAEAAEQVLKTYDLDFCTRPPLAGPERLSYHYLDIAFVPYGEYWREMRKICFLEFFCTKKVQSFKVVREEEVGVMIGSVSVTSSSTDATPVDILKISRCLLSKILFKTCFGKISQSRPELFNDDHDRRLVRILHGAVDAINCFSASDLFPSVGWVIDRITGFHGRTEKCFHDLDGFFQQIIDIRSNSKKPEHEQEDFLDSLLKLEKEEASTIPLTIDHIKAVFTVVFLAGVDTSAITLSWAMSELIKNPEAMKKVQEEIRSNLGSKGKVQESDLDQFHYLKMVVKETLRLHPAGPLLLPRESIRPSKVDGYDVLAKTRVLVNAWAIGRDPAYWQNPYEFIPERFKDSSIDFLGGRNFEFLPFGGGRRGCPGVNMGIIMTELILANLLYSFDWKMPNGLKKEDLNMDESSGISIYKKFPLELVPIKYN